MSVLFSPLVILLGLPVPWALRWAAPPRTAFMIHRERQARRAGDSLAIVHEWVPLEQLPDHLVRAVLVAEDDRFRAHHGVDWVALGQEVRYAGGEAFSWASAEDRQALRAAIRYGVEHRSELKGRSTLTQQLAKNLYFAPDRSLARKVAEVVVALRLERMLGKDRILELYLNTAELGPGIFGVGAAARAYFDVPASRLTQFQSASLAATLPHPLTSNPRHRPGRMAWRRDLILARLAGRDVTIPDEPPPIELPDLAPIELPPGVVIPPDTTLPDTVSPDTVRPDTTRPDTNAVRPDTVRPDTVPTLP